ncbi:ribosome-binding protein 1 [Cyclospora cayetanensis]|uniref:Ribosome-binding protein 1 n=1 Tax=Cyclospora cayetanensis TaxID=88456 RepID=A0A6P6RZS4_9EIME|nr:ribosome-binding protein 1 [Cyclospora cayetanensis]
MAAAPHHKCRLHRAHARNGQRARRRDRDSEGKCFRRDGDRAATASKKEGASDARRGAFPGKEASPVQGKAEELAQKSAGKSKPRTDEKSHGASATAGGPAPKGEGIASSKAEPKDLSKAANSKGLPASEEAEEDAERRMLEEELARRFSAGTLERMRALAAERGKDRADSPTGGKGKNRGAAVRALLRSYGLRLRRRKKKATGQVDAYKDEEVRRKVLELIEAGVWRPGVEEEYGLYVESDAATDTGPKVVTPTPKKVALNLKGRSKDGSPSRAAAPSVKGSSSKPSDASKAASAVSPEVKRGEGAKAPEESQLKQAAPQKAAVKATPQAPPKKTHASKAAASGALKGPPGGKEAKGAQPGAKKPQSADEHTSKKEGPLGGSKQQEAPAKLSGQEKAEANKKPAASAKPQGAKLQGPTEQQAAAKVSTPANAAKSQAPAGGSGKSSAATTFVKPPAVKSPLKVSPLKKPLIPKAKGIGKQNAGA